MKVWGKDVDCCVECKYYNQEYDCNMIGFFEDDFSINSNVSINCLFSKPITKEIIEKLGFKLIIKDQYYINALGNRDITLLIDDDLYIQIITEDGYLFQGTINNPEELRFILTSLGIIE